MKRLLAAACISVTVFMAAGGPVAAAEGVGSSATRATGNARACEAGGLNKGKSNAGGLDCGPGLTGSFRQTKDGCLFTASGTGLLDGSEVYLESGPAGVEIIGHASPTGEFSVSYLMPGVQTCEELIYGLLIGTSEVYDEDTGYVPIFVWIYEAP